MRRHFQTALLLLVPCIAGAELNYQYVELDGTYFAYERDVGDVNGDGLNDVVSVQEGNTSVEVFTAPDWTRTTIVTFTGTYKYPRADDFKVADVDGDLDTDIVVRLGSGPSDDGEGRAVWVENVSGGSSWVVHTIGVSPTYTKDICVADLDGDDKIDVLFREDSQTKIWMQDAGVTWTEVTISHAAHEGMEVGDVDMDGDPDIVLNGFWYATPNTPAACRVAGNYTYHSIDSAWYTQGGDWTANSCKVAIGDIDGDGSNDVVFSQSERAGYQVRWYASSTPLVDTNWTGHDVVQIDYCHNLQALDFDLDGDIDILAGGMVSSPQKGLRLYLNEGGGSNWTVHVVQADGSYSAEIGDIDNDGDTDIVGILNWNSAPTYIYRSNAGGGSSLDFWKYVRVSSAHMLTFGLGFKDIDADNDLDIVSGSYAYRNPGTPMTGAWTQLTLPNSVHAFMGFDVDGDNQADLIAQKDNIGANRIDLYWVEAADAGATSWSVPVLFGDVPRSDHAQGFQGYKSAQIIAGILPEIVINSLQGIYYFEVPGSNPGTGSWARTFVASNDSDEGIGIADMDGDGDLDITFSSGGSKTVKWTRNPDWTAFTIGAFPEADWPDRCEAADLNGDDKPDIVVTEENAGGSPDALAYWWEQPATSPTNANWTRHLITTRYTMNNLDLADMDEDGDIDLVIAEHRGTEAISAFENDGSGNFTEHAIGTGDESHLGGRLADLDGDGDLDVASIAYDTYQQLHVWRNDSPSGAGRVAKPAISPNGGVFDEPVDATLTCSTAGAAIWYTVDGSDPTNLAPSILYTGTVQIVTTTVLKAKGFKESNDPSSIATATFTGPQAKTPVFTPSGGTFAETVTVTIACATTGVTIRYTTDGSVPDESDSIYSGALSITSTTTLRARAFRSGLAPSDVADATFTKFYLGAIAHWRLDERFGSLAYDSSDGGHTGTVSGAAWVGGYRDNALSFDGNNDAVDAGAFDVTGTGITITAWVKLDSTYIDNDQRIVSKAIGSAEQDHYWMLSTTTVGPDRRLRFRLKTGGSTTTLIASSGDVMLNTWLHVAASYDGSAMRLYLGGAEVGTAAKSGTIGGSGSAGVMIGANPPSVYAPFKGLLDDVRIYNTGLDASAVQAVMNDTAQPSAPAAGDFISSGGVFIVGAATDPGHYYILQHATNLIVPQWSSLSTSAASGVWLDIPHTSAEPNGVYRLLRD
ncbi:MAG: FG-GAP-like repeat-containing protein [bacterium]